MAPHWTQETRGLVVGVTPDTTASHLVRAAIESVTYGVREVIDAMARDTDVDDRIVRVDSGLAENDHFCAIRADVLGAGLDRSSGAASTALGVAYAADRAVDYWNQSEFAERLQPAASLLVHRSNAEEHWTARLRLIALGRFSAEASVSCSSTTLSTWNPDSTSGLIISAKGRR